MTLPFYYFFDYGGCEEPRCTDLPAEVTAEEFSVLRECTLRRTSWMQAPALAPLRQRLRAQIERQCREAGVPFDEDALVIAAPRIGENGEINP